MNNGKNNKMNVNHGFNRDVRSILGKLFLYPLGMFFVLTDRIIPKLRDKKWWQNCISFLLVILWVINPIYWVIGRKGTYKLMTRFETWYKSLDSYEKYAILPCELIVAISGIVMAISQIVLYLS